MGVEDSQDRMKRTGETVREERCRTRREESGWPDCVQLVMGSTGCLEFCAQAADYVT